MYREDEKGRYITEGGSSNYFIVKENELFTPEIDNILLDITKEKVIKLVKTMGYSLVEKRAYLDEVFDADGIFLVSTVSKIMPVKTVDNEHFYSFKKVVRKLMLEFENTYID